MPSPDGWFAIGEGDYPRDAAEIQIKLGDGSILQEAIPQSDGEFWWSCPGGPHDVFIHPHYVQGWKPMGAV